MMGNVSEAHLLGKDSRACVVVFLFYFWDQKRTVMVYAYI